jgi:hypothetical protein
MKKASWLVVILLVLFSTLFVSSCSGKREAIKFIQEGTLREAILDDSPLSTDEVFKQSPWIKGNVKWKTTDVIKRSKKEGGNLYIVTATFDHVINDEMFYYLDDPNDFAALLLLNDPVVLPNEESITYIETTDEDRIAVVNAYAELEHKLSYNERDEHEIARDEFGNNLELGKVFLLDAVKVTLEFIVDFQVPEFGLIGMSQDYTISTSVRGKKETFKRTYRPDEDDARISFNALIYTKESIVATSRVIYDLDNSSRPVASENWTKQIQERVRIASEKKEAKLYEDFANCVKAAVENLDTLIEYFENVDTTHVELSDGGIIEVGVLIQAFKDDKKYVQSRQLGKYVQDFVLQGHTEYDIIYYYMTTPLQEVIPYGQNRWILYY